tara:strand:- start:520 stop:738 length:219 start_codon:yes stop_codon:yes gene_type:complete
MKKIKKIKINLNGRVISIPTNTTVSKVIKNIKVQTNKIAIELNRKIIDKKRINKLHLKNNDKLEIVHFIGGG